LNKRASKRYREWVVEYRSKLINWLNYWTRNEVAKYENFTQWSLNGSI